MQWIFLPNSCSTCPDCLTFWLVPGSFVYEMSILCLKKASLLYVNQCPFYFFDFSAAYPIWLCLYTSMPAVYLYFVQVFHDLSSNYSWSQLPGVKGGACWKLEGQINVHWGAKTVMFKKYLLRKVSVAQNGGDVRVSELKRSPSWSDEIRRPWICFCGHHVLSLQCFSTIKPWQNNFKMFRGPNCLADSPKSVLVGLENFKGQKVACFAKVAYFMKSCRN